MNRPTMTGYDPEAAARSDKRYERMCDLAYELAKETETRQGILELIHYPTWASPPPEPRRQYMQWAADMRAKAAKILEEREEEEKRTQTSASPAPEAPGRIPGLLNRRPIIVDKNRESLHRLRKNFPEEGTGMAQKHRKQSPIPHIAAATLAMATAVSLTPGCFPAAKNQAKAQAPVVNTETPGGDYAYWRGKYTRNRMTPPAQYSLMPTPPKNNDFGEFDDAMYRGLDRQPTLPPLPGDMLEEMQSSGYGAMMPPGSPPEARSFFTTSAPAAPRGAGMQGVIASNTHFYPVEQLVYGGDYEELDNPDAYRLMPKDEISVTVRNHPEFSGKLTIQPDGTVRIPNTPDPVHLRGMTADEAADEIRKNIAVYVKGEATVRVQANRAQGGSYFVFGDVKQPGRFPMGLEPVKLSEAVMAANFETNPNRLDREEELTPAFPTASPRGAFVTPRTADMARVMLITPHRSRPVRTTHDLRRAMLGMTAGDPPVRPGQIIIVPSLDPEKNLGLGLEMSARPGGNPLPPPAAPQAGQGFSTANSPARLPEATPYAPVAQPQTRARSNVEANLAQAYATQANEEATNINRFPQADEYWEEYADGYEEVLYADEYVEEVIEEKAIEEAVEVESVDPALPTSESVETATIVPRRGRQVRKAPFVETRTETTTATNPVDGWKKGF